MRKIFRGIVHSSYIRVILLTIVSSSLKSFNSAKSTEETEIAASYSSSSGGSTSEVISTTESTTLGSDEKHVKEEKAKEKIAAASVVINEDLKKWQEKFDKAAEDGVEDLQQRIRSITDDLVNSQVQGTGKAHLIKLEDAPPAALAELRTQIKSVVKNLPEDHTEQDKNAAYAQVVDASRNAAETIKKSAQKLRKWKQRFDAELANSVEEATSSTISVLVNVKELGMQDMGMRWMYIDGVTHKDWKKFHNFKNQVDPWKKEIQGVTENHAGVSFAKEEANVLEQKGMDVAENAAAEINRLKEVARWKIRAKDDSDDFSDKASPPPLAEATSNVSEDATSTEASASKSASANSGAADSEIAEDKKTAIEVMKEKESTASEAAEMSSKSAEEAEKKVESASKKVLGGAAAQFVEAKQIVFEDSIEADSSDFSEFLQSAASDLGDRAADLTKILSEALLEPKTSEGAAASVTSLAREQHEMALAAASSAVYGTEQGVGESVSSLGSAKYAQAVTA